MQTYHGTEYEKHPESADHNRPKPGQEAAE